MNQDFSQDFDTVFRILRTKDARFFASKLFTESFGDIFPAPANLGEDVSADNWYQYVALYKWPDGLIETVGFCNWIRYREVYLGGGLCVKGDFYRRLPRSHWNACRERGGVAQMVMEFAATELNDATAWFSHCGDKRAMIVDERVGFEKTSFEHLIVKWFKRIPAVEQDELCHCIAQLGPF